MKRFIAALFMILFCSTAYADGLSAYFTDVGQGDCTIIQSAGETMVIDTGPSGGCEALAAQLIGVERIDVLVLTHPHEDHDGNLGYLIENYSIGQLLVPEYLDDEEDYGGLLRRAVRQGTQILTCPPSLYQTQC